MINRNLCFGLAAAFVLFLNTHALDAGTIKPIRYAGVRRHHPRTPQSDQYSAAKTAGSSAANLCPVTTPQ